MADGEILESRGAKLLLWFLLALAIAASLLGGSLFVWSLTRSPPVDPIDAGSVSATLASATGTILLAAITFLLVRKTEELSSSSREQVDLNQPNLEISSAELTGWDDNEIRVSVRILNRGLVGGDIDSFRLEPQDGEDGDESVEGRFFSEVDIDSGQDGSTRIDHAGEMTYTVLFNTADVPEEWLAFRLSVEAVVGGGDSTTIRFAQPF